MPGSARGAAALPKKGKLMTQPASGGTREVARLQATIFPALANNFGTQLSRQLGSAASQMTMASSRSFHRSAQMSGNAYIRGFSTTVARGGGMVDSIVRSVAGPLSTALGAVGAAGASAVGAGLVGGFNRLKGLQSAEKRFESMGVSVSKTEKLMAGMNKTLGGTPYALDQGAQSITGLVTASTPLNKVNKRFGLIVDAAAFAQAPLNEVADIFTKITSEGRLTGERLNQFQTRGVPALSLLADAAGVTGDEMREMISGGEIDANKFFELWEKGAKGFGEQNVKMAGAAQKMGETVVGAGMNMRTALSRAGAKFLETSGIFNLIHTGLTAFTKTIDDFGPKIEEFGKKVKNALEGLGVTDFIKEMPDRIKSIGESIGGLSAGAKGATGGLAGLAGGLALSGAKGLPIIGSFLPAIGPLGLLLTTVGGLIAASPDLQDSFKRILDALVPLVIELGEAFFTALTAIVTELLPVAVVLLEALADGLEWLGRNASWAAPLILGVTAAMWLLNIAMTANPIGLIVVAIGALVAGLIWLWQNVDGFRNFLIGAWEVIRAASVWLFDHVLLPYFKIWVFYITQVLIPVVTWLWQNVIEPAFRGIAAVATWLFNNVIMPWFRVAVFYIQTVLVPVVTWLWQNVFGPAFRGIATIVTWAWNNVIRPALQALWAFISNVVAPVIVWLWQNVIVPGFRGIGIIISNVWNNVIQPALRAWMGFVQDVLIPIITWLWQNVVQPAFRGIGIIIAFVWNNVIKPTFNSLVEAIRRVAGWIVGFYEDTVKPIWNKVGKIIKDVWEDVIRPVFNTLAKFITETVPNAFEDGVDAIRGFWNKLQGVAKKPVLFVLETVYQDGLRAGWQKIADKIPGLPSLPSAAGIINTLKRARGGPVFGPGTATSDSIPAMLSKGEYVIQASSASKIGMTNLDMMNQFPGLLLDGGPVRMAGGGSVDEIIAWARRLGSKAPVTSSYRNTPDYHGQGLAVDFGGYNQDKLAERMGHFSNVLLELIHQTGKGQYGVKHGKVNPGAYASLFAHPDPSISHKNHLHVAAQSGFSTGKPKGGSILGNLVQTLLKDIFSPLYRTLTNPLKSLAGKVPMGKAIAGFAIDGVHDAIVDLLGDRTDGGGTVGNVKAPKGAIPAYFTYFGTNPAQGFTDPNDFGLTASGVHPSTVGFSSPFWPLGTEATMHIGDKSMRLRQIDFGPALFVVNRHPGKAVLDLTQSAMSKMLGRVGNFDGAVSNIKYGSGRTYPGSFRARGYDDGGWLPPVNQLGKPEPVFTPSQWEIQQRLANRPIEVHIHGKGVKLEDLIDVRVETGLADHDEEWVRLMGSQ